jgi:hypothetical protein
MKGAVERAYNYILLLKGKNQALVGDDQPVGHF